MSRSRSGCSCASRACRGSGKSSLVNDILREGLRVRLNSDPDDEEDEAEHESGAHERIDGVEHIDKVIDIDQSAIGRTPRSNPATYIKLFDEIRALFAQLTESKVRGYAPGRFSFNKPGGRCEACEGNGSNKLEMDFLADVWVTCPVCEGKRFNRETLQVRHKGKSIRDVLEMDVQEALAHFENVPKIRPMLQTLHDVGLDYVKLGPARAHALGRRGAARQAGPRAVPPLHRTHPLHPRRADDGPALRGHLQAPERAARLRRGRQLGGGDRA